MELGVFYQFFQVQGYGHGVWNSRFGEAGIWISPLVCEVLCLGLTAGFSLHYVRSLRRIPEQA